MSHNKHTGSGDGAHEFSRAILDEWAMRIRVHDPWIGMPLDDALGTMSSVLHALEQFALGSGHKPHLRATLVDAAMAHGHFRRRQDCPEEVLLYEYSALRQAISASLRRSGLSGDQLADALDAMDPAVRIAKQASAIGFREAEVPRSF